MSENNLNTLSAHIEMKKVWQLLGIVLITAVVWNLPISVFDIDGLTVVQQRIIAIFVFATLSWLTECIPAWATSLAIMTIMCVTVSENSFQFFKGDGIGELLKSKEIMASFADPIIMLFLAGFILAIAASKSGLDTLLAKNMIRPFGNKSENVLLGFLFITGIFSMFISNTATAALMLTFLAPVFASLPANGKGAHCTHNVYSAGCQLGRYRHAYRYSSEHDCDEIPERPRWFELRYQLRSVDAYHGSACRYLASYLLARNSLLLPIQQENHRIGD